MHLILTGATGLVGSAALAHILSLPSTQISRLTILSRKPVPLAEKANNSHVNIKTIIHTDFLHYSPELLSELKGAKGVIWALGISSQEVGKEEYVKITKDYTLAAAEAFSSLNEKEGFNFVYVSGEGATTQPGLFTPLYGRVKGETEAALLALSKTKPGFHVYSARAGAVDPRLQPEVMAGVKGRLSGKRVEGIMGRVLLPGIQAFYKNMHAPTAELGKALVELAIGDGKPVDGPGVDGEGRTLNNGALRRVAGL